MSGTERLFDGSFESRRLLGIWLYALITPVYALAIHFLALPGTDRWPTLLGILCTNVAGGLWFGFVRERGPWYWIVPGVIVPCACAGLAYLACGTAGLGFLMLLATSLASNAIALELPIVIAGVVAGTLTCTLVVLPEVGLGRALGCGFWAAVSCGIGAWLGYSKSSYERRLISALRQSEQKYSKVFATSRDALTITERATGRYLEVNQAFEALTGWTRAEALNKNAQELGLWPSPDHRERIMHALDSEHFVRDFLAP
ncbi:MAG TPA: PAS domain S-box protein, partial [Polyangiales bacterium]|nr:PAS domain S-box protein [Polyangiales bacterium]